MTTYSFSPSMFYFILNDNRKNYDYHGTWPDDAIEIEDEIAEKFLTTPPDGMKLGSEKNSPTWVALPEKTKEEKIAMAEAEKDLRQNQIVQAIAVYQLKLQIGRKLTPAEKEKLNVWLDYSDAVEAVDTSDPSWPTPPAI